MAELPLSLQPIRSMAPDASGGAPFSPEGIHNPEPDSPVIAGQAGAENNTMATLTANMNYVNCGGAASSPATCGTGMGLLNGRGARR